MQRRTAARKVSRALSLKARRKPSLTNVVVLPKPQFEYEDTLGECYAIIFCSRYQLDI